MRCAKAMQFGHDESFHHVTFSGAPLGFYFWPDETLRWQTTNLDLLPESLDSWCFITATPDETQALSIAHNHLNTFMLRINNRGLAWYTAYGKSTDGEFFSETFSIPDLLAQIIAI